MSLNARWISGNPDTQRERKRERGVCWAQTQRVKSTFSRKSVLCVLKDSVHSSSFFSTIMEIPLFTVDAFTNLPFKGNPAAVCPLSHVSKVLNDKHESNHKQMSAWVWDSPCLSYFVTVDQMFTVCYCWQYSTLYLIYRKAQCIGWNNVACVHFCIWYYVKVVHLRVSIRSWLMTCIRK